LRQSAGGSRRRLHRPLFRNLRDLEFHEDPRLSAPYRPAARGARATAHHRLQGGGQLRRARAGAAVSADGHLQGQVRMTTAARNMLLFALLGGFILLTGFTQSCNADLAIVNMGLISAVMALDV